VFCECVLGPRVAHGPAPFLVHVIFQELEDVMGHSLNTYVAHTGYIMQIE
jgi:hypothetical protein